MADGSGSNDGGVSGAGGVGAANGGTSTAAADAASATESVAQGLVDAATGPLGVDMDALGAAVAGLQAQVTDQAASALQAAVESQLSAVDAAQLQAAIDKAAPDVTAPNPVQQALASPLAGLATPPGLFNAQGQPIDACGNVIAELSVDRSVPFDQTAYAQAVTNLERATAGPISGPVYTAAWASGASPAKLDQVANVGKMIDGALGVQKNRASRPSFQMQAPTPAGWNQTQR